MLMKGYEIERTVPGTNPKTNRPNCTFEFNCDWTTGKSLGDAFFDGSVHANLKEFYDKLMDIGQLVYKAKGGNRY
jgi:hypothetical protein